MFFHPLGLIWPILLQLKLLFRIIVIQKCMWDSMLTSMLNELKTIKQTETNLHVMFCNIGGLQSIGGLRSDGVREKCLY